MSITLDTERSIDLEALPKLALATDFQDLRMGDETPSSQYRDGRVFDDSRKVQPGKLANRQHHRSRGGGNASASSGSCVTTEAVTGAPGAVAGPTGSISGGGRRDIVGH